MKLYIGLIFTIFLTIASTLEAQSNKRTTEGPKLENVFKLPLAQLRNWPTYSETYPTLLLGVGYGRRLNKKVMANFIGWVTNGFKDNYFGLSYQKSFTLKFGLDSQIFKVKRLSGYVGANFMYERFKHIDDSVFDDSRFGNLISPSTASTTPRWTAVEQFVGIEASFGLRYRFANNLGIQLGSSLQALSEKMDHSLYGKWVTTLLRIPFIEQLELQYSF